MFSILTGKLREQLVYLYKFNWTVNTRVKEQSFKSKENGNPRRNLCKFATKKYRLKGRIKYFIIIIMRLHSSLPI